MAKSKQIKRAIESFMKDQGFPPDTEYVIGAGAALHVHGLRDEFSDVDIYVPGLQGKRGGKYNGFMIDASGSFGTKDFAERVMRNKVEKDGLPLLDLATIREHKMKMNRGKDQDDIKALDGVLTTNKPFKKGAEDLLASVLGPYGISHDIDSGIHRKMLLEHHGGTVLSTHATYEGKEASVAQAFLNGFMKEAAPPTITSFPKIHKPRVVTSKSEIQFPDANVINSGTAKLQLPANTTITNSTTQRNQKGFETVTSLSRYGRAEKARTNKAMPGAAGPGMGKGAGGRR